MWCLRWASSPLAAQYPSPRAKTSFHVPPPSEAVSPFCLLSVSLQRERASRREAQTLRSPPYNVDFRASPLLGFLLFPICAATSLHPPPSFLPPPVSLCSLDQREESSTAGVYPLHPSSSGAATMSRGTVEHPALHFRRR